MFGVFKKRIYDGPDCEAKVAGAGSKSYTGSKSYIEGRVDRIHDSLIEIEGKMDLLAEAQGKYFNFIGNRSKYELKNKIIRPTLAESDTNESVERVG